MRCNTFKSIALFTFIIVLGAVANSLASEPVEWAIFRTLQLKATPIDVAVAPDGSRIFVLTEQGEILAYSSTTTAEAKIYVGNHVDQIKAGPTSDTLILNSRANKTVQIVTVDFFQKIKTTGAPFKGPEDAPVVISVFDDFQ